MSRISVLGATGYAGAAVVAEAAARGHEVTALSRSLPEAPVAGVRYVRGDATDEATLVAVIHGADAVVAALAPRGPLADRFREVYRDVARLADAEGARLLVVGGFSAAPATLDWTFVSPALSFGAHAPGERLGRYRLGDEVAVDPAGGAISAADYALGIVDLIESDDHRREQVNLAH